MQTVSVIIPFYSGHDWLQEALQSVFAQTVLPSEIILVNDGSRESIDDILGKYTDRIKYYYQENAGPAAARNFGMSKATGDYIAFLDADDLWRTDKIEKQLLLMADTGCTWSYTGYSTFTDDESPSLLASANQPPYYSLNIFPGLLCSCAIATPCVMIERRILNECDQCFNASLRIGEDFCFWIELAKKHTVAHTPESLSFVRDHGTNAAKSAKIQLKARCDVWNYICQQRRHLFGSEIIPAPIRIPYKLCGTALKLLNRLCAHTMSGRKSEIFAKMLYILPWLLFKLAAHFYRKGAK